MQTVWFAVVQFYGFDQPFNILMLSKSTSSHRCIDGCYFYKLYILHGGRKRIGSGFPDARPTLPYDRRIPTILDLTWPAGYQLFNAAPPTSLPTTIHPRRHLLQRGGVHGFIAVLLLYPSGRCRNRAVAENAVCTVYSMYRPYGCTILGYTVYYQGTVRQEPSHRYPPPGYRRILSDCTTVLDNK